MNAKFSSCNYKFQKAAGIETEEGQSFHSPDELFPVTAAQVSPVQAFDVQPCSRVVQALNFHCVMFDNALQSEGRMNDLEDESTPIKDARQRGQPSFLCIDEDLAASIKAIDLAVECQSAKKESVAHIKVEQRSEITGLRFTCLNLLRGDGYSVDEIAGAVASMSTRDLDDLNRSYDISFIKGLIESTREGRF